MWYVKNVAHATASGSAREVNVRSYNYMIFMSEIHLISLER